MRNVKVAYTVYGHLRETWHIICTDETILFSRYLPMRVINKQLSKFPMPVITIGSELVYSLLGLQDSKWHWTCV